MATLLLTTVGTLVGGPLGGAIGALAGRSVDGALFGGGKRDGARLRELSVTTSSYGQPIARHHGRMRAAGTIIWATELAEHKEKSGGKKGQPSVTAYAYTTSFAVALSSRPILGVERIWADGNLLRGAAGDLKVAGALRVHTGRGDQAPDPLIAADRGPACPGFRDCAYAVFEDLALGEFGNRIPALTFEIIADEGEIALADLLGPVGHDTSATATLGPLAGFANEGGPLAATLDTVGTLFPLSVGAGGARLSIERVAAPVSANIPHLPVPARAWAEHDFGQGEGRRQDRNAGPAERITALRYYDVARDFQPGIQRPLGKPAGNTSADERTIEFPGALAADDARLLADAAARRGGWRRETLEWRVAELDPKLIPGTAVRVPGRPGTWLVEEWEWRERGIELTLAKQHPHALTGIQGDAGAVQPPADSVAGPTILRVFELPPSAADGTTGAVFAAAAGRGPWSGAALYLDQAGELVPVGRTSRTAATIGRLLTPLPSSAGLLFEHQATLDVELASGGEGFRPASLASILLGANRVLVGDEIVQFAAAEQVAVAQWRLSGILRGRGGSEGAALAGHAAGADVILLDDALVMLDPEAVAPGTGATLAAIGTSDAEPVYAPLAATGLAHRPLCPVHPGTVEHADGSLAFSWIRRARGAWLWSDGVDAPLVEESELYRVGLGPSEAPLAEWNTVRPALVLDGATRAALAAAQPGAALWVRQVGRFAQSDPLLLGRL